MCSRFGPGGGRAKLFPAALALMLVFCSVCWGAGVEVVAGKGRKVSLDAGKSIIIRSEAPIVRVSSANPDVAVVTGLSPTQVYVTGKATGVTSITLWQAEDKVAAVYEVEVAPDVSRIREKIQRLFPDEKGLRVSATSDSTTLSGTVSSAAVLSQVVALVEAYGGEKSKVINMVQVSGVHQILIEVRVAEMSKTLTKQLTIDLVGIAGSSFAATSLGGLASLSTLTLPPTSLSQTIAPNTNAFFHITGGKYSLTGFLDALKEDGLIKLLAEPTLMALSGQTATFHSGGQFPVPIPQGLGSVAIEYKDYGVALAFTPTVLDDNKISMVVSPTVSELDYANAVTISGTTVPALTDRKVSTVIELADGQSFAIAGLLQDDITETIAKYPVLGDLPGLGPLFRSAAFQRKETELVVIVTPHLVKPLELKNQPLPTDRYVEPSDRDFFLRGLLQGCERATPPPICNGAGAAGLEGEFGHALPK